MVHHMGFLLYDRAKKRIWNHEIRLSVILKFQNFYLPIFRKNTLLRKICKGCSFLTFSASSTTSGCQAVFTRIFFEHFFATHHSHHRCPSGIMLCFFSCRHTTSTRSIAIKTFLSFLFSDHFSQFYLHLKVLEFFKSFVTKNIKNRNTKLRDPDAPASSSCAASIPLSSPSRALGVSSPNSSSHSSKSTTSASSPCSSQ